MSRIRSWLGELGLGDYADAFERELVDLDAARHLTDEDLKALGLPLGPRKKVLAALPALAYTAAGGRRNGTTKEATASRPRDAERRQITIMFCDLVGSTALSEKLDPEDLRALMQDYQKTAGAVIERYGGHVAQYLGDGLMTYFGWPQAHEDDAERAVRASLEIVEAVGAIDLKVRIGIATGPVVVGETGAGDASVPKLAVGETPNLAARLQGLAAENEIIVGPSTRRLLGGTFKLDELDEQSLKGIVAPVAAHKVTGIAANDGRFEARTRHLTPLVGRDDEMAKVMARWELAKGGNGQVIVISGEPGIGKSRITQTLLEQIANAAHSRARYQCSPYHTNSALYPVIEQLERAANFQRDDAPEDKLNKLESLFSSGAARPLVASMLGLPIERYPPLAMTTQKQKEATLQVLAEHVVALAAEQPVVAIFEDVHWIDPTSQEFLDQLLPKISDTRVLVAITHRLEYEPAWQGVTHISLERLDGAEALSMLSHMSEMALTDDLRQEILTKSDGVPLYVEELTKTVADTGATRVPETLQDSLMARLDGLGPAKEIAQIGACIGRSFRHEQLLSVVDGDAAHIEEGLQALIDSNLVRTVTGSRPTSYVFNHALVQDSAYESLLKSSRTKIHERIASTLAIEKETFGDTDIVELARHYALGGNTIAATKHLLESAQANIGRSAYREALGQLDDALEWLSNSTLNDEANQLEAAIQVSIGGAHMAIDGWGAPDARRPLSAAWSIVDRHDLSELIGPVLSAIVSNTATTDGFHAALVWVSRFLDRAAKLGDRRTLLLAHTSAMSANFWLGDLKTAQTHGQELVELYEPEVDGRMVEVYGFDALVMERFFASHWLWMLGYPDQAVAAADEKDARARELAHPFNLAFSLATGSAVFCYRRETAELAKRAEESAAIGRDQSIPFFEHIQGPNWQSHHIIASGDSAAGVAQLSTGLKAFRAVGGFTCTPYHNTFLSAGLAEMGRLDEALSILDSTLVEIQTFGEHVYEAEVYRRKGRLLGLQGASAANDVEIMYQKALSIARAGGARGWELRAATSLAELWATQGKKEEARDLLGPIFGWFTEGFDTRDLLEAKALLDGLAASH